MRTISSRLLRFGVAACFTLTAIALSKADVSSAATKPSPVKVIFDTDMQNDCDDAGALATLNALADLGEAEILACVVDSRGAEKAMAATVSAINTYYGRPNIPIGTYQAKIKGLGKRSAYVAKIRDEFPHRALPDDEQPTSLTVYRTALAAAPDSSVAIISVGFLPNLSDLLKSEPDALCPLSGPDLVRAKVKRLVVMGGEFPKGTDGCNLVGDSVATQYVVAHWPTPILFSGGDIGNKIVTGKVLAATPASNPVRRAYELRGSLRGGRQSWDLTAVLAAVRDPRLYWDVSPSGTINVARDGKDEWLPTPDQGHTYLIEKFPPDDVAKVLNDLIAAPPALNKDFDKPIAPPATAPATGPAKSTAEAPTDITWKKILLTDKFYAEGAYYADFNKDGKLDVVYGPYWYEGPDFTKTHHIYPPTGRLEGKSFDPKGYSDNFQTFCSDFNSDGYPDVLIYTHPGGTAALYLNPGANTDGPWTKSIVCEKASNESPAMADVDGTGKQQGLFHTGERLGYFRPDYADLTKPWTFVPISEKKGMYGGHMHGYGAGNIAGHSDKKLDILAGNGWWENPGKDLAPDEIWKFHPVAFSPEPSQLQVYDVDGDGLSDVICASHAHGYGMVWWKQAKDAKGEITFTQNIILDPQTGEGVGSAAGVKFSQLHAMDMVDVDGDGLKDIITGKRWWAHGPDQDIDPMADPVLYWFQLKRNADKSVEWIPHLVDKASGVGTQVTGVDLNGDGLGDIIVGNKRGGFVFLSQKP